MDAIITQAIIFYSTFKERGENLFKWPVKDVFTEVSYIKMDDMKTPIKWSQNISIITTSQIITFCSLIKILIIFKNKKKTSAIFELFH